MYLSDRLHCVLKWVLRASNDLLLYLRHGHLFDVFEELIWQVQFALIQGKYLLYFVKPLVNLVQLRLGHLRESVQELSRVCDKVVHESGCLLEGDRRNVRVVDLRAGAVSLKFGRWSNFFFNGFTHYIKIHGGRVPCCAHHFFTVFVHTWLYLFCVLRKNYY